MTQGFALLVDPNRQLSPFQLPWGLPESEVAQQVFSRFKDLYGVFARAPADEVLQRQEEQNRKRNVRIFGAGEVVFRKLPALARPAKHLLGDRCSGPYIVVAQRSYQSAVLKDPASGELVDQGRNIPLDQLLTGPRRSKLVFDDEPSEIRGIGEMLRGEGAPEAGRTGALIRGAGRKKGWRSLAPGCYVTYVTAAGGPSAKELTVGRVIRNDIPEQRVMVQPYRGVWMGTRVVHRLEYLTREGVAVLEQLDDCRRREELIRYVALVTVVELLMGGELMQSCSRRLEQGGWGLKMEIGEQVQYFRQIGIVADLHCASPLSVRWDTHPEVVAHLDD